jgi:hypothetical protein
MLFNSLTFFALLLPTLALYWLSPWQPVRLALLLAASMIFYGYFHWPSVFLLVFTITFNHVMDLRQMRVHRAASSRPSSGSTCRCCCGSSTPASSRPT